MNQKYIFEITIDNDKISPYNSNSRDKNNSNDPNAEGATGGSSKKKMNHTIFSFSAPSEKQAQSWIYQFERILTINKALIVQAATQAQQVTLTKGSKKHKHRNKYNNDSYDSYNKYNNENEHDSLNNNDLCFIPNYGCQHYRRNCYIKSKCCNRWYFCSYCHDEREDALNIPNILKALRSKDETEDIEAHTLDRSQIDWMTCVHCGKEQKAGNYCINPKCRIKMARYYCHKCKFWNNDANVKLFHCDGCGVCRTGNKEDYQHCNKCGVCLTKVMFYFCFCFVIITVYVCVVAC